LQTRAQLETIASQTEANKQLLMGVMLDNLGRFESHLNYLAAAAYFGQRREVKVVEQEGRLKRVGLHTLHFFS
jgi:hypothetical protein